MVEPKAKRILKVIGWCERVNLPELQLRGLKVKVDSGARTSALHATRIRYLQAIDGSKWVSFLVSDSENRQTRVRAKLIEHRQVKSSLGHVTTRPVIETLIQLGDQLWPIELTLVNRDPMGFRMLLGRQAIRGRFLIHPGRGFALSKEIGKE